MNVDLDGGDVPLQDNLQDLIRDRKAERKLKAEEKRRADLQRIRDMRSTTGIDRLQQFPKEIWLKILDELDPEDQGKLWELHPVFRDLLEATRIRDILLPQLVKIDAFQSYVKHVLDGEFNEVLRLISKSSRKSFDNYMEAKLIQRVREMKVDSCAQFEYVENFHVNVDNGPQSITKLLELFRDGENPAKHLFTRELSISFSPFVGDNVEDEDDDFNIRWRRRIEVFRNQFMKNLTALLELIGGQIWHFRIFLFQLENTPYSFSEVYILLQRWLTLMPNLRWLVFCNDDSEATIIPEKDKKNVARNLTGKNPLPRLEYLERLSFHFRGNSGQMEIFEALIAANPHVKTLDFTDGSESKLRILPIHQLKSLQLTGISVKDENRAGVTLSCIESTSNFNWKLSRISLDLDMRDIKLESVFRFLEKFPTLDKVVLNHTLGLNVGSDDDNFGYLELPNLMHFTIMLSGHSKVCKGNNNNNTSFFFSLQFLLHCKKLKTLFWYLRGIDDDELRRYLKTHERRGKTMDFRAGLRFLYESIIWDVFPFLDTVTVVVEADKPDMIYVRAGEENRCTHTYRRLGSSVNEPVGPFLRSHSCSRNRTLKNCVALLE